jgi:hypothetical protein
LGVVVFDEAPASTIYADNQVEMIFTISGIDYTEYDDGIGGFSNMNGYISSASINYTNGDVAVTFNSAIDIGTRVRYKYYPVAARDLGDY